MPNKDAKPVFKDVKFNELYGGRKSQEEKAKERIDKHNKKNKKPQKEKGFLNLFNDKNVTITLINGNEYKGVLKTNAYNRYDVLLETNNGRILIPKHSILVLMEVDGKEK